MVYSKKFYTFLCISIIFSGLLLLNELQETVDKNTNFWSGFKYRSNLSSRLSVCMMLPVTSRGVVHNFLFGIRLADLPIVHSFIPSLIETAEDEYEYRLYIGYDYDDSWYDNDKNWKKLLAFFQNSLKNANRSALRINIRSCMLYGIDQRITAIWNTLAGIAYKDLCDYYYPANDDLKLITKGWTSKAIQALRTCPVASNFGIVAFRDRSACQYPTFHLTHRTHLDLHDGIYYPLPSHGAHQDPWIFSMYRAWNCAFFLPQYELTNHIGLSQNTRYNYGPEQLVPWIQRARKNLYNRLLFLSIFRYNQSFIDSATLDLNIDWLVPC